MRRSRITALLGMLFALAIFGIVLPRVIDYGDVWTALLQLSWLGIVALVLAAALNVATYGPPLMAVMPGLRYWPSQSAALTSTASTYLAPGGAAVGMAVGFGMLRAMGFPRRSVTVAISLFTLWNQLIVFGLPAIALGLLSFAGERNAVLENAARIGTVVFLVIAGLLVAGLWSPASAERVGNVAASVISAFLRLLRRGPVSWSGTHVAQYRSEMLEIARARWHWMTLASLSGHLTTYLVLIVALRAVGVESDEVSLIESFAAWTLARLLGAIPIMPGGIGVVDVGLTAALLGFGGRRAEVVTAVLLYRLLTIVPPLVYGAVAGSVWRHHHPEPALEDDAPAGA